MGENHFAPGPSALYGFVLVMAAIAYLILQQILIASEGGAGSLLKKAVCGHWKGKLSPVLYVIGIALNLWQPWMAQTIYVLVALLWLIPDRRIERALRDGRNGL